jgi:hypothetical protein
MKRLSICRITPACLALLVLLVISPFAMAQQNIPDARLRVTVQQLQTGKLNSEYHLQELRCFSGKCSLITVTLGGCRPKPFGSSASASAVIIERSSTDEGTLRVSNDGNTLVTTETGSDIGGSYTTTQRFTYDKPRFGMATQLIGYSGGFVKNSTLTKQVLTVEFVALKEDLPGAGHREIRLSCPLGLPGVSIPLP